MSGRAPISSALVGISLLSALAEMACSTVEVGEYRMSEAARATAPPSFPVCPFTLVTYPLLSTHSRVAPSHAVMAPGAAPHGHPDIARTAAILLPLKEREASRGQSANAEAPMPTTLHGTVTPTTLLNPPNAPSAIFVTDVPTRTKATSAAPVTELRPKSPATSKATTAPLVYATVVCGPITASTVLRHRSSCHARALALDAAM